VFAQRILQVSLEQLVWFTRYYGLNFSRVQIFTKSESYC